MSFKVLFSPKASKEFKKLDPSIKEHLKKKLKEFSLDPFKHDVVLLSGSREPKLYRLRIGDYRFLFWVDYKTKEILIERFFTEERITKTYSQISLTAVNKTS